ncbi:MAG: HTTM domain-containing protein [Acidimicrobiales bacterium]|nr:HTTM domain-containing protein [Acidimicrobiales bacterium]RZV47523.1 MAG: hypothetical protein EX269_04645 [Acidimicrobiales bacterium]
MSMFGRLDGWLAPAVPAQRIAAIRVIIGTFSTVYLLARFGELRRIADQPATRYEPLGVLSWIDTPLSVTTVTVLLAAAILSGVAFVLGWRFRLTGPAHAALWLILGSFHSSWGQLLHFEHLLVIHLSILGLSSAADAWGVDSSRAPTPHHGRYGFPLRLAAIATVLTYVLAAVAKLRETGFSWVTESTLRNHIGYTASRLRVLGEEPAPLADLVDWVPWLFPWIAAGALVLELIAPVALLGRRWATAWVIPIMLMHIGIVTTMWIFFPYQTLGLAFLPFFAVERWVENAGRFVRFRSPSNEMSVQEA